MEQGQARVAQSGLRVPLSPTGQQQQEDEVSEWKETPWRGDRASTALTRRPVRHIATILKHRVHQGWQKLALCVRRKGSLKQTHTYVSQPQLIC